MISNNIDLLRTPPQLYCPCARAIRAIFINRMLLPQPSAPSSHTHLPLTNCNQFDFPLNGPLSFCSGHFSFPIYSITLPQKYGSIKERADSTFLPENNKYRRMEQGEGTTPKQKHKKAIFTNRKVWNWRVRACCKWIFAFRLFHEPSFTHWLHIANGRWRKFFE